MRRWNHLQRKFRRKSALALMAAIGVTFSFAHFAHADAIDGDWSIPTVSECQFVAQLSSRPAAKKRSATTLDISFLMSFQQVRPARAPPSKSSC
jgi:hypothetical protein